MEEKWRDAVGGSPVRASCVAYAQSASAPSGRTGGGAGVPARPVAVRSAADVPAGTVTGERGGELKPLPIVWDTADAGFEQDSRPRGPATSSVGRRWRRPGGSTRIPAGRSGGPPPWPSTPTGACARSGGPSTGNAAAPTWANSSHREDVGRWLATRRWDWGRLNEEQQRRLGELGVEGSTGPPRRRGRRPLPKGRARDVMVLRGLPALRSIAAPAACGRP